MRPGLPQPEFHRLLAAYDVMLFPSIWDEPLSNTMIEAMALGLLVTGTTTGGSGEILRDGQTGLTFPAENCLLLAEQILRSREQLELLESLADQGERFVRQQYTMEGMLDQIEKHLLGLLEAQRGE
jgi:glycosyltransferase involved in cell wall biosynthesis